MSLKQRIKAAVLAVFGTAFLWTAPAPVQAAGTTPLALAIQYDSAGNLAPGCLLYFFIAGTVAAPQNSYSDFGLTTALGNPLQCDQSGRVPMHWLADGLIHIRLTTAAGSPIVDTTMQVLGPSSGGGGGGSTVDPTTVFQTGALMPFYGTGPRSGFVRANGLTIGNATCGCTERANADTQALFIYLYGADPNLAVSGGRTGNALNDYNASKQLSLPDWRGRALAFLDDMGSTPAGRLTNTYYGNSPLVLGSPSGTGESRTLITSNLPPYTPAGSVTSTSSTSVLLNAPSNSIPGSQVVGAQSPGTVTISSSFAGTAQGGTSAPFSAIPPTMLATIYLRL